MAASSSSGGATAAADGLAASSYDRPGAAVTQSSAVTMVKGFLESMGGPRVYAKADLQQLVNPVYALFGAKTKDQQEAVRYALAYLMIAHDSSSNVDWKDVVCRPDGCTPRPMSDVVDGIVTRAHIRKFAMSFLVAETKVLAEVPAIKQMLAERAVRSGLPVTATLAVISHMPADGLSPGELRYRAMAKSAATTRANVVAPNSLERSSEKAHAAITSNSAGGDDFGPI